MNESIIYEAEYSSLRAEMLNCTNLANQISTFSMTALAGVLAFAFSLDNPFVFLVPYVFILPLSSKAYYYRKNVVKIAAYLIVNLEPKIEGRNWETLNLEYADKKQSALSAMFRNYEFLLETLICYALFLASFSQGGSPVSALLIVAGLAAIPIVCVYLTSRKSSRSSAQRQECLEEWKRIVFADKEDCGLETGSKLHWG